MMEFDTVQAGPKHTASKETVLYFFGYKKEIFSLQNYPRNLDPSYKTDLDLWDN